MKPLFAPRAHASQPLQAALPDAASRDAAFDTRPDARLGARCGARCGAWRVLPGFLALGVAAGAGCYVLAYWAAIAHLTLRLYAALAVGLVLAFGAQFAGADDAARWARGCHWARRAILGGAIVLMMVHSEFFVPEEARLEVNQVLALMVAWFMVALVFAVGLNVHGRPLPVSVPLIPGLSLFGLLNIVLVDSVVEIGFLVYVGAALFLLAYERRPLLPGSVSVSTSVSTCGEATRPEARLEWARIRQSVGHYGLACGAWFGFFVCGAALIYYPLQAVLPSLPSSFANRLRENAPPALRNWAGSQDTVELNGGRIELSDRVVLRVWRAPGVESQGLWRGRVYHRYDRSRWLGLDDGTNQQRILRPSPQRPERIELPPPPLPDPALARLNKTFSQVELTEPPVPMIFAPGKPITVYAPFSRVRWERNGTAKLQSARRGAPERYEVTAIEAHLRPAAFDTASGLSAAQLNAWKADSWRGQTLQMPDDIDDANRLRAIARTIEARTRAQGKPFDTPAQKAQAVAQYLGETCVYSLDSPVVPLTEDSVLFFLTQSKAGACDMFASSMAMLLRSLDVPARLVTGYLEPEIGANPAPTPPTNESGEAAQGFQGFNIEEKQAHAWVEYYVPRVGWLSYDPTANTRTTEPPPQSTLGEILDWPQFRSQWKVLLLPVAGGLLIMCSLAWSLMDWRKQQRSPQLRPTPADLARQAEVARITRAYERAARLLRRKVARTDHLTPQEYEALVSRAAIPDAAKQEFSALTHLLIQARYGLIPPQADAALLRLSLERLRQALK